MSGIHLKRNSIKLSEDGKLVQIPVNYLKQIGKFIEGIEERIGNPDPVLVFAQADLRTVNTSLKFIAGKKDYHDWDDPFQTEKILIKHCPGHWWKWIIRSNSKVS